jgi:hypothetical protein
MQAQQMISTHPDLRGSTNDALIGCIEECYSCAQACTSCADACLAEDLVKDLTQCIRLNLCRRMQRYGERRLTFCSSTRACARNGVLWRS